MSALSLWIAQAVTFLQQTFEFLFNLMVYCGIAWVLFVAGMYLFIKRTQDFNRFSKFGKALFYAARYSANVIKTVRSSQFYVPLQRLFKFDPALLMLALGMVLFLYVANLVIQSVNFVLAAWGLSLGLILSGALVTGIWKLLGAVILTAISFILMLMMFMFMNYLFGMLGKLSRFAGRFVDPLRQVMQGAGISPNWSFFLLYLVLSIFQQAFTKLFFG